MGRGKSGIGPRRVGVTDSEYSSKGEVPLIANDTIGRPSGYQGSNLGSGVAASKFDLGDGTRIRDSIDRMRTDSPRALEGAGSRDALRQIEGIRGPDSKITVYRATPGDSINHGDWVFLSEKQADRWARATLSKKPKKGYKVVKAKVRAKQVGWTGKNLEFVML